MYLIVHCFKLRKGLFKHENHIYTLPKTFLYSNGIWIPNQIHRCPNGLIPPLDTRLYDRLRDTVQKSHKHLPLGGWYDYMLYPSCRV